MYWILVILVAIISPPAYNYLRKKIKWWLWAYKFNKPYKDACRRTKNPTEEDFFWAAIKKLGEAWAEQNKKWPLMDAWERSLINREDENGGII
jgi:hypothetical protein